MINLGLGVNGTAVIGRISSSVVFPDPVDLPDPEFTTLPSISPNSGTVAETTYIGDRGIVFLGTVVSQRWLLSGQQIGTTQNIVVFSPGQLVFECTAVGPGGTTVATSAPVTVLAQVPEPTPDNTRANSRLVRANHSNFYSLFYEMEQQLDELGA